MMINLDIFQLCSLQACKIIFNKLFLLCATQKYNKTQTSCLFLCSTDYKVLERDFPHVCGINSWLYKRKYIFSEAQKNMILSLKTGSLVPCVPIPTLKY
jgi:hypothetical protein